MNRILYRLALIGCLALTAGCARPVQMLDDAELAIRT